MYAAATAWNFKPGTMEQVRQINLETLIPAVTRQPGFRHYYAIQTGPDSVLTVILFDTQAQAEAAGAAILPLVREKQGHLMEGMQRYTGPVAYEV